MITYLGILVPLLVGGMALSFDTKWLAFVVVPAGILSCFQLALSAWSLVAKWDDKHAYSLSSVKAQTRLFNSWDGLAKRPPSDLDARVRELDTEDQRQEQSDLTQNIQPEEKRYAMRAALYHFGSACVRCKQVPSSMKSSNCDTCGNF
jgi:mobilome CxxCx(11)CxxC protein